MLLAISIINLVITAVGIIGIPYLIAKGKIRQGISPVEHLKFEIISEMHKLRSQGKTYCHIYKMRDTIFQKRNPRKDKSPTLKYLGSVYIFLKVMSIAAKKTNARYRTAYLS